MMVFKKLIKRIIDIIVAGMGLIILSPVIIFVFILIWAKMGRPIVYAQMRPGLHGKVFKLYKFRTMTDQTDSNGNLLPDEVRMTSLGRVLRSTSLDELPELANILLGDMSLIGPRPLLVKYLDRYTPEQQRRHEVKPGLTGWAQVNGRNALSWEEKFAYDVWYVDNWSLWLDFKILLITIGKVFSREGISAEGEATMPEFMGYIIIKTSEAEAAASNCE